MEGSHASPSTKTGRTDRALAQQNVELAQETKELLIEVKDELNEVKEELKEVKEEIKDLKDDEEKDHRNDLEEQA